MISNFDTNSMDILKSLPLGTLHAFAKKHGVNIPEESSFKHTIEEIEGRHPGLLANRIREAFLIDVDAFDQNIRDELKGTIDSQVTQGMKGVEFIMKSVESLRWVLGTLIGILTLVLTLGGIFSTYKLWDLDKELKNRSAEIGSLKTEAAQLVEQQQAFAKANAELTTKKVLDIIDNLLESLSLTLPNTKLISDLHVYNSILTELQPFFYNNNGSTAHPKPIQTLSLLRKFTEAIESFESINNESGRTEKLKSIIHAAELWGQLTIPPDLLPDSYSRFCQRFPSYRLNMLGILAYKQADASNLQDQDPERRQDLLEKAEQYFKDAISDSVQHNFAFTRPRSNLALILSDRAGLMSKTATPNTIYEIYNAAQKQLQKAISDEPSDQNLALLYNNQASTYLDEAEYNRRRKELKTARQCLDKANKALKFALDKDDKHPAVYTTQADEEAERILLDADEGAKVNYASRTEAIVEFTKKAIRHGYRGYRNIGVNEFFRRKEVFNTVSILDKENNGTFREDIQTLLNDQ